ncbi:hypothetical protein ACW183_02275, partial [Limosilactobacillus fermentum]
VNGAPPLNSGRTMDFPVKNTPWNLTYLPKGYLSRRPLAPQAAYPSKYAILGGMRRSGDDYYLIGDGFNQAGASGRRALLSRPG